MAGFDDVVSTIKGIAQNVASIAQTLMNSFPQVTGTATSATSGSASALPGTPAGYITMTLPNNGGTVKVPYYNL